MSETVLAFVITFLILAGLAVWVPMLHLCDGCVSRFTRSRVPVAPEEPAQRTGECLADVA